LGIWHRMEDWASDGNRARIAVVGAGYVGRGIVYRLHHSKGMLPSLVINRTIERGLEAFGLLGHDPAAVAISDNPSVLAEAIEAGRPALSPSPEVIPELNAIDLVVEGTGAIEYGAKVMLESMAAGKDVISMNAEVDALIGYLLHHVARERGVVYTIADGDQPGVLLRQIEFVAGMGFEIAAAVNCKRHLDVRQTPDAGAAYARRDNTSLPMTTAVGDGTKMNIENAVVANATGLQPDCRGMHGVRTNLENAATDIMSALSHPGAVEYTLGGDFAAGVGVVGHAPDREVVEPYMRYFKMGDGPYYFFFRPYHLVHLEVPVTIAEVVLDRISLSEPNGLPVADIVAIAKRDLKPGEALDGIGGYTCYGQIDTVDRAEGLLPIGLAEHARVTRPIPRDHPIEMDAIELNLEALIVRLRNRQQMLVDEAPAAVSLGTSRGNFGRTATQARPTVEDTRRQ
jgi:predicted homoserine dehydrogenase-like protein